MKFTNKTHHQIQALPTPPSLGDEPLSPVRSAGRGHLRALCRLPWHGCVARPRAPAATGPPSPSCHDDDDGAPGPDDAGLSAAPLPANACARCRASRLIPCGSPCCGCRLRCRCRAWRPAGQKKNLKNGACPFYRRRCPPAGPRARIRAQRRISHLHPPHTFSPSQLASTRGLSAHTHTPHTPCVNCAGCRRGNCGPRAGGETSIDES